MNLRATIVRACLREGRGGSPTAVLDDTGLSDAERRAVPVAAGTSHAVFVSAPRRGPVGLRFFTATGELPACGHGTVAALAVLAGRARSGRVALRAGGRCFWGEVTAGEAVFDPGPVELRDPDPSQTEPLLRALGIGATPGPCCGSPACPAAPGTRALPLPSAGGAPSVVGVVRAGPLRGRPPPDSVRGRSHAPDTAGPALRADGATSTTRPSRIASVGRPRLLVHVPDRETLAALAPDLPALRQACDRAGLLGVYVHSPPSPDGRAAARMFAPSIGVPEDVANANSTACLAAHLAGRRPSTLFVDMGDALGEPATIAATAEPGPRGPHVRVGGSAAVGPAIALRI